MKELLTLFWAHEDVSWLNGFVNSRAIYLGFSSIMVYRISIWTKFGCPDWGESSKEKNSQSKLVKSLLAYLDT